MIKIPLWRSEQWWDMNWDISFVIGQLTVTMVLLRKRRKALLLCPAYIVLKTGGSKNGYRILNDGDTAVAAKWSELYNLNIAAIGADPGKIYVGQKLTLPAGW
ncbi:MAG: hypothetical protein FWH17_02140 [Oscillospiraceae bacterium]|nr:hypothetical protein [Oscillospiraceae bacterium]